MADSHRKAPRSVRFDAIGELTGAPRLLCFDFGFKVELRPVERLVDVEAMCPQPVKKVSDQPGRHLGTFRGTQPFVVLGPHALPRAAQPQERFSLRHLNPTQVTVSRQQTRGELAPRDLGAAAKDHTPPGSNSINQCDTATPFRRSRRLDECWQCLPIRVTNFDAQMPPIHAHR